MKLFKSERCCLSNNVIPAAILVDDLGKIIKIYTENSVVDYHKYPNVQVIDVGASVLMAGIVDSHVHVNEPGRTDWEGYVTATKAAAAGGITTIVDMPLNSIPPTTTLENLHIKQKTAQGQIYVDVGFWGGLISGNEGELLKMVEAGVVGFKCFMCPSGVDEFPCVNKDEIKRAAQILEKTDVVLAFHAEVEGDFDSQGDDPKKYHHFLKTRPDTFEIEAIKTVVDICSKHNLKCHIVHLSTAKALPLIETAKLSGCKLTVETCHHYLSLFSEDIQDGATQFKCCPPIRDDNNRTELWKAVQAKQIDMIVSDHSPCTPNLKCLDTGDFIKAWGGISSLQFGLSLFWTEARNRGFNFWDITKLMSIAPASLCGLSDLKGQIKEGLDADFVIWDPEAEIEISAENIFHKNKVSPYIEKKLYGKVLQTIVRGQTVYKDGMHCSNLTGILLKRK